MTFNKQKKSKQYLWETKKVMCCVKVHDKAVI